MISRVTLVSTAPGGLRSRLDDLVHVDVAPAARGLVHDLDDGGLAGELAHVPRLQCECFAAAGLCRSGRWRCGPTLPSTSRFMQVFSGVLAAADEEADELALDPELRRRERAGRAVAVVRTS